MIMTWLLKQTKNNNDNNNDNNNGNNNDNLREFACLTTVILAPVRMEGGLHAGSATSLPLMPRMPRMPLASYRSMVFFEV